MKPTEIPRKLFAKRQAGLSTSSLRPPGTISEILGHSCAIVSMSNSNALPLLDLRLELGLTLLKLADVIKLPLSRLTGGKGVARSLQGNLVVGVNGDGRERALSAARLADAVGRR